MELIDRDKAFLAIEDLKKIHFDRKVVLSKAQDAIKNLPAVPAAEPCEDAVSRAFMYELGATCIAKSDGNGNLIALGRIDMLPPAQPEQHIDADGTLWITVTDIERVTRVIVDEDKSKFCRQFYMDAQPQRTGKWIDAEIPNDNGWLPVQVCDQCNTFYPLAYTGGGHRFCPNCGADMRGEQDEMQ